MKIKVNRIELIDHTNDVEDGGGRVFVKWEKESFIVETSLQDNKKTLKIFINPKWHADEKI